MRVLCIDCEIEHSSVVNTSFDSSLSCPDFDIVLWDPGWVMTHYLAATEYRGLPAPSESVSARLTSDVTRRRREIYEMLELGRTVVVLTSEPQEVQVDTGKRKHSGTGRNRQTTRIVERLDLLTVLPDTVTVAGRGENISFVGDEMYAELWRRYSDHFSYRATIERPAAKTLMVVAGTKRVVSTVLVSPKGGTILYLPDVSFPIPAEDEDDEEEQDEAAWTQFMEDLIRVIVIAKEGSGNYALPDWAGLLVSAEEERAVGKAGRVRLELREVEQRLAEAEAAVARLQRLKILFAGSGNAFEVIAGEVFSSLGFAVEHEEDGRRDLLLTSEEGIAVVEAKGLVGSAGERHAAQLEKWVSMFLEERGQVPKGILVVNGFRNTPLGDRREPVYPHQMLAYCKARNHCLVTGVQLFCLYHEVAAEPTRADALRRELFATSGPLEGHDEWSYWLRSTEIAEDSERRDIDLGDT